MDLLARIDAVARDHPDRVAHVSAGRSMTYGELLARAGSLAAELAATLPDDGAPIVLEGHKEPELLVGFLACARTGHPYLVLDAGLPPARRERVRATARPSLALSAGDIATRSEPRRAPPPPRARDDVLYIMFTSGSTGEPKGVPITRANLAHFCRWMLAEHRFDEGREVFLNQALYSFDLSHMDTYLSLLTGGTLASLTRDDTADPRRLFAALRASGTTVWVSTPTFAQMCLVERRFGSAMMPALRRVLFCGEALAPETASMLLDRFPDAEVWNTYGPTEATIACTSVRVDRELLSRYPTVPIGRPMTGSRVALLDDAGEPVAPGERGEIVVSGPNVGAGYLHRPDLTARAFFLLDGQPAYRTGDQGHEEDGLLFWDGRLDLQIKLHGHRVELGDVEANLCALPGVLGAVVLPERHDGRVLALAAFVVVSASARAPDDPEGSATAAMLRASLAERVPEYMVPRTLRTLDAFPMTAHGKVDRTRLAELVC